MKTVDVMANLASVCERIARVAGRVGRDPDEVRLVAVSKGIPADRIPAGVAWELGENRPQELASKQRALADRTDIRWHLIGPLQRNKVRGVAGAVVLIHSVDSERLAEAIAARARAAAITQDVLVEVNTSGEATKHGVLPADAARLAEAVAALEGVRLRGLMTIAAPGGGAPARASFASLRALRDELSAALPEVRELSMGMSGDLEEAIEEGATIVRVGTAIFGPRAPG